MSPINLSESESRFAESKDFMASPTLSRFALIKFWTAGGCLWISRSRRYPRRRLRKVKHRRDWRDSREAGQPSFEHRWPFHAPLALQTVERAVTGRPR